MRFVVALAVAVAGCYRPSPPAGAPCANGECPSGLRCVDDICISGDPDGDGSVADADLTDAAPALVPSNGISPSLLDGATAMITADKLDFDTETGRIKSANVVVREAGQGVRNGIGFAVVDGMGVFTATSMTVPNGNGWTAGGDNAWVLYAATTITVLGEIDAGATVNLGGPGGKSGGANTATLVCRGGAGLAYPGSFGEGGGGAGGATTGGDGGPANQPTFGIGGTQCDQPSTIPLRGGNGGGAGGFDTMTGMLRGGVGGGGGGAIALVAMDAITITGVVGVPGGGGDAHTNGDGGGGGGGGGAILLESPLILVEGALTANGGGGGAPSGADGNRGTIASANTATGGSFNGKRGGHGGAGTSPPSDGETYDDGLGTMRRGGGGGGAAGRIEVKAILATVASDAVTSPPVTMTTAVLE